LGEQAEQHLAGLHEEFLRVFVRVRSLTEASGGHFVGAGASGEQQFQEAEVFGELPCDGC
jgi:hypothetical protein